MKNHTITGLLKQMTITYDCFDGLSPSRVLTEQVQIKSPRTLDPFWVGCNIPLPRLNDGASLLPKERLLWPYVAALRTGLEKLGTSVIRAERELGQCDELHGACDLLVWGGLRRWGVVEVKVTKHAPDSPRPRDLTQLGGYLDLAAKRHEYNKWWGCVAYVSLSESTVTLFAFRDVHALIARSHDLLTAA